MSDIHDKLTAAFEAYQEENAKFSEIVSKHGIKFIGPSADIISKMGDKIEAKRIAKKFGLPVIEGSEGGVKSVSYTHLTLPTMLWV